MNLPRYERKSDRVPVEAERWNPSDADQAARLGILAHPGSAVGHLHSDVIFPGNWIVLLQHGRTIILNDAGFDDEYRAVS